MQILQVPIEKLKRDKHQPRTVFDEEKIKGMAQSIQTEGIINPVELDKTYTIITGEMRYRAAKLAGLKTIPCKIISIDKEERYRRQVIENLHNQNMNDWDTAKALEKLLLRPGRNKGKGHWNDEGISQLARELGIKIDYVREHLKILERPAKLQALVKENSIPYTMLRALDATPEEFKPTMEKKILRGEFQTRDSALEVSKALNRNPEKADELFKIDYAKLKTLPEVVSKVTKISPQAHELVKARLKPAAEFIRIQKELLKWVKENPPESIVHKDRFLTILGMSNLVDKLNEWGKKASNKQLT